MKETERNERRKETSTENYMRLLQLISTLKTIESDTHVHEIFASEFRHFMGVWVFAGYCWSYWKLHVHIHTDARATKTNENAKGEIEKWNKSEQEEKEEEESSFGNINDRKDKQCKTHSFRKYTTNIHPYKHIEHMHTRDVNPDDIYQTSISLSLGPRCCWLR